MSASLVEAATHIQRAKSVVKSAAKELSPLVQAVALVVPVVCAALFYVWSHVATVRLGFDLSRAGETHRALLEENRALRVEVASLKAPERLKEIAAKTGLQAPRADQIVRIEGAR